MPTWQVVLSGVFREMMFVDKLNIGNMTKNAMHWIQCIRNSKGTDRMVLKELSMCDFFTLKYAV